MPAVINDYFFRFRFRCRCKAHEGPACAVSTVRAGKSVWSTRLWYGGGGGYVYRNYGARGGKSYCKGVDRE